MKFKFTRVSSNIKTGPIPVTMTERASCPETCPLRGAGCYAENFPLVLHWNKVADTGIGLEELCAQIKALPDGQLWRHNAAGDLPEDTREGSKKGDIDAFVLFAIAAANHGRKGFTYTHRQVYGNEHNQRVLAAANEMMAINVSANSAREAATITKCYGLPTVCLLPKDEKRKSFDVDGVKVVTCPATIRDDVTCASCGMCALGKREFIIGFPAHGARAKKVDAVAKG